MFSHALSAPWTRLPASLAVESLLVFTVAALLARYSRRASGQRTIWRMSFIAASALMLAELSGFGHAACQRLRPAPPAPAPPARTLVVTVTDMGVALPPYTAPRVVPLPETTVAAPRKSASPLTGWWLALLAAGGLGWLVARRSFGAFWLVRFGRRTSPDDAVLEARVQALARQLGIRRRVRVKVFARLSSPIAFGVFRPVIGLPPNFASEHTATRQEAMLAHELAHIAAFDAAWMLLADVVAAALWWHPLAWWARRRLRAACEAAADEASLLLDDGPAVLAECLVALGGRLARTPAFGGLGMAEHRFRSELGHRVERLLAMRGQDWRPWRGASAWLTRTLGPVALVALALAAAAWLLPREARAASLGEAIHRSPLGLLTTALLTADENDAPTLILQGRKLLATGQTNEAEAKWRAALELDPANPAARDYLVKLGRTNFPPPKPVLQPVAPPASALVTRPDPVRTSKARLKIYEKLDNIRVDKVKFDYQPLSQVLDVIYKDIKNRDPERTGINFVISTTAVPAPSAALAVDPTVGLPVAGAVVSDESDIGAATIKIDPPLSGPTLHQLLDILTKVSDRPIKYSVEDWGVLFSARSTNETPVLHTRWYKVDPNRFMENLNGGTADRKSFTNRTAKAGADFLTQMTPQDVVITDVRRYFGLAGVDLQPPKSVVFNDRLGMLMVRATLPDLDLIEQAVQVLNWIPPQVEIEVKFCEVPEDSVKALGFDLFLGSAPARSPAVVTNPPVTAPSGPQRRGTMTNSSLSGVTGILTRQQYAAALKALEQREGVEILATQKVLTPSGRQAQLKTVDVRTIVTGLQWTTNAPGKPPDYSPITEPFELGPVMDVIPFVAADGYSIQMTVIPSVKEFVGYDLDSARLFDNWDYVESPGANPAPRRPPVRQPTPLPIFRVRHLVSSATVWDGQTLVLYTHSAKLTVPDNHPAQKLQKELLDQLTARFLNAKKVPSKALLVFVTPRIVDPAGSSVHTDEEIRARAGSVPPQVPPQK